MTPKQKSEQLLKKFMPLTRVYDKYINEWVECIESAKECVNITIDEIIEGLMSTNSNVQEIIEYYKEVKNEINNY